MQNNIRATLLSFCDLAQQTNDGKMNILGVFSQIVTPQMPAILAHGYLIGMFIAPPNTSAKLRLQWENASNMVFKPIEFDVSFGSEGFHNMIITLDTLSFPSSGIYECCIYSGEVKIASIPLTVMLVTPPSKTSTVVN